jgi:hypothetical protein
VETVATVIAAPSAQLDGAFEQRRFPPPPSVAAPEEEDGGGGIAASPSMSGSTSERLMYAGVSRERFPLAISRICASVLFSASAEEVWWDGSRCSVVTRVAAIAPGAQDGLCHAGCDEVDARGRGMKC